MCQTCVRVPVFTHTPPHTPPTSSQTCLRELWFMLRPCSVSSWSLVCLTCLTDGKKCSPKYSNFCSSLILSQILPNHSQMAESESRVSVFNRRMEREGRLRLAVVEEVGRAHEKMAQRGWREQTSQPNQGMQSPACHHSAPSTCSLSLLWPSCFEMTLLSWLGRRVRVSVQSVPWSLKLAGQWPGPGAGLRLSLTRWLSLCTSVFSRAQ